MRMTHVSRFLRFTIPQNFVRCAVVSCPGAAFPILSALHPEEVALGPLNLLPEGRLSAMSGHIGAPLLHSDGVNMVHK